MKMTRRISSFILFLFGTMFLFSGCATKQAYEGSKLPRESVAVIKDSFGVIDGAGILQVDGKKRGFFDKIVEVLPGEHTLVVQVHSAGVARNKALTFNARAGHVYRVDGKVSRGNAIAWIEDETTNEVVAGERTPEHLLLSFPHGEEWVKGSESEDKRQMLFLVEYVRKGETVKNWTELYSLFNTLLTESSPTREQLMNKLRADMQQRCPNVEWKLIQQRSNELLYEWRITKCAPHPDQHEIARIMDGKSNRWKISYTAKVTGLPEAKRKQWIDLLLRPEVKQ